DEHDPGIGPGRVVQHGEHGGGAGVPDHLELSRGTVGEPDGVDGEVHDPAAVDRAAGYEDVLAARGGDRLGRGPGIGSWHRRIRRDQVMVWTSTGPRPSASSSGATRWASPTTTMARRSGRRCSLATRRTSSASTAAMRAG